MKSVLVFFAINLILVGGQVVAAGAMQVLGEMVGPSDSVLVWFIIGVLSVGAALLFLRGALRS